MLPESRFAGPTERLQPARESAFFNENDLLSSQIPKFSSRTSQGLDVRYMR